MVARPPSCERSAMIVISGVPKRRSSSISGFTKDVPAKFASQPSARSSSVEWPTVSWMVSQRLVGSMTTSYWPASTDLASSFCRASCRRAVRLADEAAATYSQPAARAGARLSRVAKRPGRLVDGGDREVRLDARAALKDAAAAAVGEEPLLARRSRSGRCRNRRPRRAPRR